MKRAISSALAAALALGLLVAPASGAVRPASRHLGTEVRKAIATDSGWRRRCNRKPTPHKRRACKRRHRRHAAAQADRTYAGTMATTIDYYDACRSYLGRTTTQIDVGVVDGSRPFAASLTANRVG